MSEQPLIAFYGDDFTGSTDALEALTFGGLNSVLFTRIPTPAELARFRSCEAIGIAGVSRSKSPAWMDMHLPRVFEVLSGTGARIVQYKVCSTFDSAPEVGSIGKAIDIGMDVTGSLFAPCVIGAPNLGRWQVFGNLFATADGRSYRIDRHPTMSRHPVTPMTESDLGVHLGKQTHRSIEILDFVRLAQMTNSAVSFDDRQIVLIDVLDEESQRRAGAFIWHNADTQVFSASSSGLNQALVKHWHATGLVDATQALQPPKAARQPILVVSGSCSPVTASQIEAAAGAGFVLIRLDVNGAAVETSRGSEVDRVVQLARQAFSKGDDVVIYAARTVDDEAFGRLKVFCAAQGMPFSQGQAGIGFTLAAIAHEIVESTGVRRLLVAGGDTSGAVVQALPIYALQVDRRLCNGAPICRALSDDARFAGLELVLKGGQIGPHSLFMDARAA